MMFFARPNPGISFYLNLRIAVNLRQTKIEAGPTRSFYLTNSVVNSNTIMKCYCPTFLTHEIDLRSNEIIRSKNQDIYDLKLTEKLKDKLKFASSENFTSNFLKISSFNITFLWFLNDGRSFHWNGQLKTLLHKNENFILVESGLTIPKINQPFQISFDDSQQALGAVLPQADRNAIENGRSKKIFHSILASETHKKKINHKPQSFNTTYLLFSPSTFMKG